MVQKVVGSIPITHPISECSTAVSIQVFQTWDESSILSTRTKLKNKNVYVLYFFNCLYEKYHVVDLLAPEQKKKEYSYSLFFWSPVRENLFIKLLAPGCKKEEHLCSYFLVPVICKIWW